jgi:hypothetical protein
MDCAFQLKPQAPSIRSRPPFDDDGVTHLLSVDKGQDISHRFHHQLLLLLDAKENTEY